MIKGLEHLLYEENLAEPGEGETQRRPYLSIYLSTIPGEDWVKNMEPDSSQWCPVTGQEAMGISWNTGDSVSKSKEHFYL